MFPRDILLDEANVQFANRNHNNGPRQIGAGRKMERAGVVIEARQPRSKLDAGDVVLNKTVDVDDGGGVTELDASDEYEDER